MPIPTIPTRPEDESRLPFPTGKLIKEESEENVKLVCATRLRSAQETPYCSLDIFQIRLSSLP